MTIKLITKLKLIDTCSVLWKTTEPFSHLKNDASICDKGYVQISSKGMIYQIYQRISEKSHSSIEITIAIAAGVKIRSGIISVLHNFNTECELWVLRVLNI